MSNGQAFVDDNWHNLLTPELERSDPVLRSIGVLVSHSAHDGVNMDQKLSPS